MEKNLENNKLIAEFMGKSVYPEKIPSKNKRGWKYSYKWEGQLCDYHQHQIKYDSSWDWQIPAYSKAMNEFRDIITPLESDEHLCTMYNQRLNAYESAIFQNNLEYGFDTLVTIIKIIKSTQTP